MRKILSLIILFSFTAKPAVNFSIIAYYQTNLSQIIEDFCVNKDKPELNCDGKCYLAEKLNQSATNSDKMDTSFEISESFTVVFFSPFNYESSNSNSIIHKEINQHYKNNYSFLFSSNFFVPPNV